MIRQLFKPFIKHETAANGRVDVNLDDNLDNLDDSLDNLDKLDNLDSLDHLNNLDDKEAK